MALRPLAEEALFPAAENAMMAHLDDQAHPAASIMALTRKDEFADGGNIESCCRYLNQSLAAAGFPALPLQAYDADAAAAVCNCVYSLLQQRQRDVDFRDSAAEQRHRLAADLSRCEARVQRLQAQLEARERDLAAAVTKEQKAAAAGKAALDKMKDERDEFHRIATGLQQRQAQLQHELRKKEGHYARLQERLSVLMAEKKEKLGGGGMEIMTLLQKGGRQRGTWDGKKADGDFYKMIVDAYEAKKQELTAENAALKDSLRTLQEDMQRLVRGHEGGASSPGAATPSDTPLKGRLDVFDMPYPLARDRIEHSLRAKMASLQERMAALASCAAEDEASERELELDAQLAAARAIIGEQEAIIAAALHPGHSPQPGPRLSRDLAAEVQLAAADEDVGALREHIQWLEAERQQGGPHRQRTGNGTPPGGAGTPPHQEAG
ncbi:Afadin/alpha-actinin-binding protein [Klebsormidium nitens]|uniref:Afadin/alpha-actinin-binding protein n=1 Tax=Klebsormidium nitens TaxID=105231 RepID=A0A1Y1ID77_KLENI|nr:Afadin/alpha-actinin-binding protein [Klebsormidium nitens]|eukprot:GAQ88870.1 Afadin/alpha-actinin-binding protein [Klebsormidium nitens]